MENVGPFDLICQKYPKVQLKSKVIWYYKVPFKRVLQ